MTRLFSLLFFFLLTFCVLPVLANTQISDAVIVDDVNVVESTGEGWMRINSDSIEFYYLPDANIKKLEARLRTRDVPMNQQFRTILSNRDLSMEDRISVRLGIILLRVKEILGMNPAMMQIKIKVFKNRSELEDEYQRMIHSRAGYKSFYIHRFKSIFTSEQDFLDSVIAHELGHAVIDHYFAVPPPTAMAELMATYVDAHLDQN